MMSPRPRWLLLTLLAYGCGHDATGQRADAQIVGQPRDASHESAHGDASLGNDLRDAHSEYADAADTGSDATGTERDATAQDATRSTLVDANDQAAHDATTPTVPDAVRSFNERVESISQAHQTADGGGPHQCATPLPARQVSSPAEARTAVQDYVATMLATPAATLVENAQVCGDESHARCADMFNNDNYHFGGTLPQAIYPLAQEIDAQASSEQLVILTSDQSTNHRVAVVLSGIENGWLVGIAFFGDRDDCGPQS
jgi:hypothetical protein